ncbi:Ca2-modulated nonselective cation channel polycystin [Plasmopara halstedii]|uniref:Ca2-modulated nonselective cation channel polycystin n=1 Tax=Plasmopara halstedii TaxID=4781 RepID=A0A0N7L4I5_PLAHL|nr:Ca2-modulated nonselective cation channel polycystin [Plasmopara halstedii]CEG38771.1 Ca2-modulated nonselective cation channel polycystin [Plasmopara halstedii]|eukprot:XP_024575140.1 Ca2-modulated nonselective cation channel polycystin [Plasmopara halstedii]
MAHGRDKVLLLSPNPYDNTEFDFQYHIETLASPKTCHCREVSVQSALDKLWCDEKHAADMKEISFAIMSFCIFVAAMYLHIPTTSMYYQNNALSSGSRQLSTMNKFPGRFMDIETVPGIFYWLNSSLVPQVFATDGYNGEALSEDGYGRIGGVNKVLGGVSFQVTRMEPEACDMPEILEPLYAKCYDESKTTIEELFISFDTNETDASAILAKKKADGGWLNTATQQLLITIITVNGELPGYAVTKLQLDFSPGGFIEPYISTTSTLLDQFPNATTIALDILVLLWFFPWALISALGLVVVRHIKTTLDSSSRHLNELIGHAGMAIRFWAFPDGWFAIDALRRPVVYAYFVTVVIAHNAMTSTSFRAKLLVLRNTSQNKDEIKMTLLEVTESFEHIVNLTTLLRLLATAAVFVLGLRVLNTFRNHVGLSILTRTIASAVRSFRTFSVIFAVVFIAFASTGTVLFGTSVEEFSSFFYSMKACVNMLFNNFNIKVIDSIDFSLIYYWSYMSLMTFVLLNIVLAIVVDAYKEERKKKDKSKCWVFLRVLNHVIRQWFAPLTFVIATVFCCAPSRRYSVVFWGRIRTHVLREALADRLGVMPLEWSPQTKLTSTLLKTLFPDATVQECEATLQHLTTQHINKDCCPISEEPRLRKLSSACTSNSLLKSPANEIRDHCHDSDMAIRNLSSRLHVLEQKLDFLIEKLTSIS